MSKGSIVMGPHIATTIEFCDSSKTNWDSIAFFFFFHIRVVFLEFMRYMKRFTAKQSRKPLFEYYSNL